MAGGSPRHAALAARVARALAAGGGPCEVFSSDLQLGIENGTRYVYADVTVICGPPRLQDGTRDVVINPTVVVEVLSESTEAYDRGIKWQAYQELGSLTDYVLVAQSAPRIEHYHREPDGSWRYRILGPHGSATVSTGAVLSVDDIHDGVFALAGEG